MAFDNFGKVGIPVGTTKEPTVVYTPPPSPKPFGSATLTGPLGPQALTPGTGPWMPTVTLPQPDIAAIQAGLQYYNPIGYSPNPAPVYGGGYGGGGAAPAPAPAGTGVDLEALKQQQLEAALAALNAKYAASAAALKNQRALMKNEYGATAAQIDREKEIALEDTKNDFGGRNIARSGFMGQELASIEEGAALAKASALAQYQAQAGYIQQQLKQGLIDQQAAEQAQILAAIELQFAMYQLNQQ